MRLWIGIWIAVWAGSAWAEPLVSAQRHLHRGLNWKILKQDQKAIEEFEQAYQEGEQARCLYHMADSYERLAKIPTKTTPEVLDNKQRALSLYESFIEQEPDTSPLHEKARERIESLRRETEEIAARLVEREASLKTLNDKMDQLLTEFRALRELLLRRERGANSTGFLRPVHLLR